MSVVCLLNIATAPATEPQELVTHPPHLRTLPVSYQSQPAGVHQPQPIGVHQRTSTTGSTTACRSTSTTAVGVHQPQPIGVHQPMPVNNRNLSAITEDGTYVDKVITIMYYN